MPLTESNFATEWELLTQISRGDERAFQELFYKYSPRLFKYILSITKSKQTAEELVSDVFLKIWLGREIVHKIENFEAFLFRVTYNKSIDFLRSVASNPIFSEFLWDSMQGIASCQADDNVVLKEYKAEIQKAINLLSPQRKKVYELSREQDLSHAEIASQLNISKNTVNNHIVEAQRFIRSYFSKTEELAFLFLLLHTGLHK